jgi:hypothetical protein
MKDNQPHVKSHGVSDESRSHSMGHAIAKSGFSKQKDICDSENIYDEKHPSKEFYLSSVVLFILVIFGISYFTEFSWVGLIIASLAYFFAIIMEESIIESIIFSVISGTIASVIYFSVPIEAIQNLIIYMWLSHTIGRLYIGLWKEKQKHI